MILGKEFENDEVVDQEKIIIILDKNIKAKIINLHKSYQKLEVTSRRPDRNKTNSYIKEVEKFKDELSLPFNISRKNAGQIMKDKSGIKMWKEDFEHLQKQLLRDQPSGCDSFDVRQYKRDARKNAEKAALEKTKSKIEENENELKNAEEYVLDEVRFTFLMLYLNSMTCYVESKRCK